MTAGYFVSASLPLNLSTFAPPLQLPHLAVSMFALSQSSKIYNLVIFLSVCLSSSLSTLTTLFSCSLLCMYWIIRVCWHTLIFSCYWLLICCRRVIIFSLTSQLLQCSTIFEDWHVFKNAESSQDAISVPMYFTFLFRFLFPLSSSISSTMTLLLLSLINSGICSLLNRKLRPAHS